MLSIFNKSINQFSKLFYVILLLALTSCISRVEKHGYMFDISDHNLIENGITSKERVRSMMGSPTFISDFDSDEAWIYYAEEVERILFFKPDIISRTVLLIRFDRTNTVKDLTELDLMDEDQKMQFVKKFTIVEDHKEPGFFKSLFGNVGQIRPQ